jgi:ribosomal protein S18 acetylase RimI-like enzyme
MNHAFSVEHGFPDSLREQAATLFDAAFGEKISVAIPGQEKRLKLFAATFDPSHSMTVVTKDKMLGIAGFKDSRGALTSGITFDSLRKHLGFLGAVRAGTVLTFYERELSRGELLMDGISVAPEARGEGIGTQLLNQLIVYAGQNGYQTIRLDVIDTNPDAKRLYQRVGFVEKEVKHFPYLKWLFGFSGATTLEYQVDRNRSRR